MADVAGVFPEFIGRSRELRAVTRALEAAHQGAGGLLLVTGEAGIGKTWFCRELAARAHREGLAVAWGSGWPDGEAPPLWPWRTILTDLGDELAVGLLAPEVPDVDPERFARFDAIARSLADTVARRPALIVLDDVQLADRPTLILLRLLARSVDRLPLLLVLAARGTGTEVAELPGLGRLALTRFDQAETRLFLAAHDALPADAVLADALFRLTGGHPLHLQRFALQSTGTHSPSSPGSGVYAAVAGTVAELPAQTRKALQAVAVLGMSPALAEVAAVADVSTGALLHELAAAQQAGLVSSGDRVTISHEVVREVLLGELGAEEARQAHARAAAVLAATVQLAPGDAVRMAQHAVQAAALSPGHARAAVIACRHAAKALTRAFGYEQAAALLAAATNVQEQAGSPDPSAELLVEWAEAVLRCGLLADARKIFERAATRADNEDNPEMLARAALGLGGLWVNENRNRFDHERVRGLQTRALQRLSPGDGVLRLRLRVRLAAEEVYHGGPVQPVLTILDDIRETGDGAALAEALSLCHHVVLTTQDPARCLALADELITVATAAGEGTLALVGLCWRAVDLFHLGDSRASSALNELHARADMMGCRSILYIAETMRVMTVLRAGRLDAAEEAALACHRLGLEVGDADADGYLMAQLFIIRWLQGREVELLTLIEELIDQPTLNPAEFAFQATAVLVIARSGAPEQARTRLRRLTDRGLAELPRSSTWLAGLVTIVEAARLLDEAGLAEAAYGLLEPYRDLPLLPSLAVICVGSMQRALGLAAATRGDLDRAVRHLSLAVDANQALPNRPLTAIAMADLAHVLVQRGAAGDVERAAGLIVVAAAEADEMAMTERARQWHRGIGYRDATIGRRGAHWEIIFAGQRTVVPDLTGMRYLVQLLTAPGRTIAALTLAGGPEAARLASPAAQEIIDARSRIEYHRRVAELNDRIDAATDTADALAARAELDALLDHLRRATGRGGRPRGFPGPGERARTAVRKAIKRAVDEIAQADPSLGAYLAASVTTGSRCCYQPDPETAVRWRTIPDA